VGPERYFFEMPIYRVTEAVFIERYRGDLDRFLATMLVPEGHVLSEGLRLMATQHFWEKYGMPWRYNQAVGWVRLYALGSQVRGETWLARGTRHTATGRREYRVGGKAFEHWCHPGQTSDEIRGAVEEELLTFARTLRRGHVLDLECFHAIAPFVDWRALVFGHADASA
jgi:hypothetical protein